MGKQEEEENLLETTESASQLRKRSFQLQPLLLIISVSLNIFFGFFGLFSLTHGQCSTSRASYELGFASDLGMCMRNGVFERHDTGNRKTASICKSLGRELTNPYFAQNLRGARLK